MKYELPVLFLVMIAAGVAVLTLADVLTRKRPEERGLKLSGRERNWVAAWLVSVIVAPLARETLEAVQPKLFLAVFATLFVLLLVGIWYQGARERKRKRAAVAEWANPDQS